MIVAGESSGELYGALLADALRQKRPGINLIGIGGERMKEAGVSLISGISSAFGLTEALSALRQLRATFRKAVQALHQHKPAVLVLIDYPDFNLRLAVRAKKMGIRILYYVSPQVWVWRRKRIFTIAGLVNRMAVILPFEESIYREIGLECEFVGHPVYDEIQDIRGDRESARRALGLDPAKPLLALLPGSRPHELEALLPVMIETVTACRDIFPDLQYAMPLAPNTDLAHYVSAIEILRGKGVALLQGKSLEVLAGADFAVIASGTATLQAALLGVPMAVIYKVTPLTFFLGRLILNVTHVALVNILAGREVVREFLQGSASADNVVGELQKIVNDSSYRSGMIAAYGRVRMLFQGRRASGRVADMVIELAGWSP